MTLDFGRAKRDCQCSVADFFSDVQCHIQQGDQILFVHRGGISQIFCIKHAEIWLRESLVKMNEAYEVLKQTPSGSDLPSLSGACRGMEITKGM